MLAAASAPSVLHVVIVTGLSGSGKSVALGVLEDSGYYCVDNLPVRLLPELLDDLRDAGQTRIAVSIDARTMHSDAATREELPQILTALRARGLVLSILFLEAKTDVLVKRYSETRRRHPLNHGPNHIERTVSECVVEERALLEPLAAMAHHMDTSDVKPSALRQWVKDFVAGNKVSSTGELTLIFTSFGFKAGIPLDADLVFDVRALPNPHYEPDLKRLTGRDAPVIAFLEAIPEVQALRADIEGFVGRWLPSFERDNRHYLTVAIGCTGGQHRSVYFAETLARHFAKAPGAVLVRHRELRELHPPNAAPASQDA